MDDYWGLLLALAIGLPLLAVAVLADRRHAARLDAELADAPTSGDEDVDAFSPEYVTQAEIDRLPLPTSGESAPAGSATTRCDFGHVAPEFATHEDVAHHADVHILLVGSRVETMRELVTPLSRWAPLVIVAEGFHDEVMATLRANRKALQMPVVAVAAPRTAILELAEIVSGQVLESVDLRSGYLPQSALGEAAGWWSTLHEVKVEVRS